MPRIEFFEEVNRQISNKKMFGLCDDKEDKKAAYIDEDLSNMDDKWCGVVKNEDEKVVAFYPVDNCVDIKNEEGKQSSRCDGILRYDDSILIFTELKDRKRKSKSKSKNTNWRKKGEEQILTTLRYFFSNYDKDSFKIKAWICNKRDERYQILPNPQEYSIQITEFKRKTEAEFGLVDGINLWINREIKL
ncbi:MAG: hypothetical protein II852_18060 [Bacteroidales bacterium]|nr:hypothetical protein [Bacteroidales bacterium]